MSIQRRWLACIGLLAWLSTSPVFGQEVEVPRLMWFLQVTDGLQGENGVTFELFGPRTDMLLKLTISTDKTDEAMTIPGSFAERLRFAWDTGSRTPVSAECSRAELQSSEGIIAIPLPSGPLTLEVGRRLVVSCRIPAAADKPLDVGEHKLALDIDEAVKTFETLAGTPWRGGYSSSGDVTIRVVDERDPAAVKKRRFADAASAMERNDYARALVDYRGLMRDYPSDINARAGAGQAYMMLKRFPEAVSELELVLVDHNRRGLRSLVPIQLAYSYLALGQEQRAETVLRPLYGADALKNELARLKELLRQRGVR